VSLQLLLNSYATLTLRKRDRIHLSSTLRTSVTSCLELHMANTEEQELDNQIKQLSAKLKTYKKALTNPHLCQGDYRVLMGNILWIEAEISELQAQLEIHRLIGKIYNTVAPALLAS